MSYSKEPIVLISGFKAGTWLMREILTSLTDMSFFEPDIIAGERKYYNPEQLQFVKNHFYSWHLVPTGEVVDKLNKNSAKTIFVVRNIYDLVVSIYYHFFNNIDADIGRGNNKDSFLKQFSFEEDGLRWNGMSEVIDHYNEIFKASSLCDSLIIDYDKLVKNKEEVVKDIAKFLGLDISTQKLDSIINSTKFETMKANAQKNKVGDSHFREGKAGKNRERLSGFHKIQLRQMIKITAPDIYENARNVNMQKALKV